jgi:hypothetical protein
MTNTMLAGRLDLATLRFAVEEVRLMWLVWGCDVS